MPSRLANFGRALLVAAMVSVASAQGPSPTPPTQSTADAATAPASQTPPATAVAPASQSGKGAKKVKKKKEKKPKLTPVKIERGTLTVDGYTGKAALNYDIPDLHFLYMYVPGAGTVVVGKDKFPGAAEQKDAFHDQGLTVNAGGHVVEVYSERRILSKKPESAWVLLDPGYSLHSKYPVFGYGNTAAAPYAWPGAKQVGEEKGVVDAPPLPASVRPTLAPAPKPVKLSPSPAPAPPAAKPVATTPPPS